MPIITAAGKLQPAPILQAEAVGVAVTENAAENIIVGVPRDSSSKTLQALTAAALVLPGLLLSPVQAAEDGSDNVSMQFSRYEESERELVDVESGFKPIAVDTLHASGKFNIRDNYRIAIGLTQDTWSGASPVATAPLLAGGNRAILRNTTQGVITSGASPYVNGQVVLDRQLNPVRFAPDGTAAIDTRNVLIMSSASPEMRQQVDATVEYQGAQGGMSIGAGISDEDDYLSRFGNLGGRLDFNQKLTSINFGAGYTSSNADAVLDPDLLPYLNRSAYASQLVRTQGSERLQGKRNDRTVNIGLTQVVDASTLFDVSVGYTSSRGFMENPYKATTVIFVGPEAFSSAAQQTVNGDVRALLEQRPDKRRQLAVNAHYVHHLSALDAALHLEYQFSSDDWDIDTHSLEVQWVQPLGNWTFTPRVRYYTQGAANFYQPFLLSRQFYRSAAKDAAGREIWLSPDAEQRQFFRTANGEFVDGGNNPVDAGLLDLQPQFVDFSAAKLPQHFSSDPRLAAFGSVSAGLTLRRSFARGFAVEAGFEFYQRASGRVAGNKADSSFADMDYVMANLALEVDLQATTRRLRRESLAGGHAQHAGPIHVAHQIPAGIMFGHRLTQAGAFMAGYRVSQTRQSGALSRGTESVLDASVVATACSAEVLCRYAPQQMNMTMHMLDLMYAPTDSITLMLMPQFTTMDMQVRELAGRPAPIPGVHEHGSMGAHFNSAVGDTVAAALISLHETAAHALHLGLGVSIPTGKVDMEYQRSFGTDGGLQHFDMQTGSGTWDLLPSLTWSGTRQSWHWGLQVAGSKRLESRNASGYRLGNVVDVSAWAGHNLNSWLSSTLRVAWADKGELHGDFTAYNARSGPMDFPANQGGRLLDLGVGVTASLAGSDIAIEWLQPLRNNFAGVQLERRGVMTASWRYGF